jgi:hypothetical protein
MNCELTIRTALTRENSKFALILGSGFNASAAGVESILASWQSLMGRVLGRDIQDASPTHAFERHLLKERSTASAAQRELVVLREIRNHIMWETERVLASGASYVPAFLFDPSWVSDILTLNFDDLVERYCRTRLKVRVSAWRIPKGFEGRQPFNRDSIRYRELIFPGGGRIRVWHLHGSVSRPGGIQLGIHRYALRTAVVEALRRHYKQWERRSEEAVTWYSALHRPVMVLGASLSEAEWDLWAAIIDRERNYAKPENRRFRKPMFQMREKEEGFQREWFQPLFSEGGDHPSQWKRLEEIVLRSKAKLSS